MTPHPFPFRTRIKGGRVQKVFELHFGVRQGLPSQEAMPCSLRLYSLWHDEMGGGCLSGALVNTSAKALPPH